MTREEVALGEPPADLVGFPGVDMGGQGWFRAHRADRGVWWFSQGGGRFDLEEPRGTCYLASDLEVAVRERLGEVLVHARAIPAPMVEDMAVSRLTVAGMAADAVDQGASRFGVTRELGTVVPYDLPRRWAAAFDAGGWDGVRYAPRFSVGSAMTAVGVFGTSGADGSRAVDPHPVRGYAAAWAAGVEVAGVPREVPVVSPPGVEAGESTVGESG